MTVIEKKVKVPYRSEQIFGLVSDINSYQEFLPWCEQSRILSKKDNEVLAELVLSKVGLNKRFTTKNTNLEPDRILIELVEGPFKKLQGSWDFVPDQERSTFVSLKLEFEFSNRLYKMALEPVFHHIATTLVDSFTHRARVVFTQE